MTPRVEFVPFVDQAFLCTGADDCLCVPGDGSFVVVDGVWFGDVCCRNEQHIASAVEGAIATALEEEAAS